ncbi:MAG: hypothetical protein QW607_10490 [Desulfurococcaceae archaeon]
MEVTKIFLFILFLTGISAILYLYYTRKETSESEFNQEQEENIKPVTWKETSESKFNQEQEENIKPVLWYYDPFFWFNLAVFTDDDDLIGLDLVNPVFIPVYLDTDLKEKDLTEDNKQSIIDHHKK